MPDVTWEYSAVNFVTDESEKLAALTTWLNGLAESGWEPVRMDAWFRDRGTTHREVLLRRPRVPMQD